MNYFSAKEKYINASSTRTISKLFSTIEEVIAKSSDSSLLGRGLQRCIQIELCYIMVKYRRWAISDCLSEATIDFLNSEYRIARAMATELVESCLDIIQSGQHVANFSSPEDVDRDFLLNLFVETTIAKNESKLEINLGFGRNLINIIENATVGVEDHNFEYSSSIKAIMTNIIQEIIEKIQMKPWIIDLYRLRNILFSKSLMSSDELDEETVENYFNILNFISFSGISRKALAKMFKCSDSQELALSALLKAELVYLEPRPRSENDVIHLSKLGIEITAEYFANGFKKSNATDFASLTKLPSQFQTSTLNSIGTSHKEQQLKLLEEHGFALSPGALEVLAKNLQNSIEDNKIIDIFWNIYQDTDCTFFVRSAIVNILGEYSHLDNVMQKITSIAVDKNNSKLVSIKAQQVIEKAAHF